MKHRIDAPLPYQCWRPFPPEAIVQVWNAFGDSRIDLVKNLWWGYETDLDGIAESVIFKARRLDKPKGQINV